MLTEEQIEYLNSMKFINVIDDNIRVLAEFEVKYLPSAPKVVGRIILVLNVFFRSDKITRLTFDLQNYNYDDLVEIAKNIKSNEFIMYELDTYLASDIE